MDRIVDFMMSVWDKPMFQMAQGFLLGLVIAVGVALIIRGLIGMREQWVVFYRSGKELASYTLRGTFKGELEETINLLAYENGCAPAEISYKIVTR